MIMYFVEVFTKGLENVSIILSHTFSNNGLHFHLFLATYELSCLALHPKSGNSYGNKKKCWKGQSKRFCWFFFIIHKSLATKRRGKLFSTYKTQYIICMVPFIFSRFFIVCLLYARISLRSYKRTDRAKEGRKWC